MSASISKICRRCATGRGPMPEDILCLNAGSSSLKFALYRMGEKKEELLTSGEMRADSTRESSEHRATVRQAFADLEKRGFPAPAAVGDRLVHGGPGCAAAQRIDAEMLAALRQVIPLAPLHLPSALEVIEAVTDHYPDLPQVACFDTAFHRGMPELAQRFPLPRGLWSEALRRYGFHGLSYEYIVGVLGPGALTRTIIAHLGNGASLVAIRDGRPMDTTMGLALIGGVETLVFTGGIGERAAPVRWEICQGLAHLGIRLDPRRNAEDSETISAPPGACAVRVIPTNEDLMIARHTRAVLRSPSAR